MSGALAQRLGQRRADRLDVERLLAGEIGNAEAAAEIDLGRGRPASSAISRGERDGRALGLDQRVGIERLAAGEDVQAAPVGAGRDQLADQRRHAVVVDAERAGERRPSSCPSP